RISRRAWERPRVVQDRRPAVGESREDVLPAPRPERSVFEEFEGVVDADGRPLERALDSDKAIRATNGRLRGVMGLDRCECPKPLAATCDFAAVPAGLDEIVAPFEQDRGGPELVDGKGPRVKRLRVAERFDPRCPARHAGALRFLGRRQTEPELEIVEKGAWPPRRSTKNRSLGGPGKDGPTDTKTGPRLHAARIPPGRHHLDGRTIRRRRGIVLCCGENVAHTARPNVTHASVPRGVPSKECLAADGRRPRLE